MKKIEWTKELILEDIKQACLDELDWKPTEEELAKLYKDALPDYDLKECRSCGDLFQLSGLEDFCGPCRFEAYLTLSSDYEMAMALEQRNRWN